MTYNNIQNIIICATGRPNRGCKKHIWDIWVNDPIRIKTSL